MEVVSAATKTITKCFADFMNYLVAVDKVFFNEKSERRLGGVKKYGFPDQSVSRRAS